MHTTSFKYIVLLALILSVLTGHANVGDVTLPLCSASIHDSYHAIGPNGVTYLQWHPQTDPSGCHFDHEHGSNPDLFQIGFKPVFGYSASTMGMSEGNAGFKGYAFEASGYHWYITQHFGTSRADLAACVRMHTLDIAARNADNVLVVNLHLMGDFGASVNNGTNAALTPPTCVNQGLADGTGVRKLPVAPDKIGYEPWRVDSRVLPFFSSGGLTFNTPDAQTACDTDNCTSSVTRGALGAYRFLTFNDAIGGFKIHATSQYSNTFTFNNAQQYIAPNFDVTLATAVCVPYGADYWYDCVTDMHDAAPFLFNPFITGSN